MKAAYRERYGGAEVLEWREIPVPEPRVNEVRIKVEHTTINRTDCGAILGNYLLYRLFTGLRKPKNPVPGTDVCGVIDKIGASVTDFKVGDRVAGFNDDSHPTQAEYCVWPEKKNLKKVPEQLDLRDAVAVIEGGHYALNFLNKVNLKKGDRVMVNGGTGAIGSLAVQLLADRGIEVVATARTQHLDLVRELGASKVIDYTKEDFTQQNDVFDFVFDAVGKSRFKYCKRILKPRGIYISSELGPNAENVFLSIRGLFSRGKHVKFPFPTDIPGSIETMFKLLDRGAVKPVIDREYSIEQIREAYEYVLSAQKVGAVVLRF